MVPLSLGQPGAPPGEERKQGSAGTSRAPLREAPVGAESQKENLPSSGTAQAHSDADPRAGHDRGAPSTVTPLRDPLPRLLPQGLLCR